MRSTAVKAFDRNEVTLSIADQLEKDIATLPRPPAPACRTITRSSGSFKAIRSPISFRYPLGRSPSASNAIRQPPPS